MPRRASWPSLAATLLLLQGCVEREDPATEPAPDGSALACQPSKPLRKPVDPELLQAFAACCDGSAHLIPDYLVPGQFRAMLMAGTDRPDTLCVPDVLASDPLHQPASCSSIGGREGRCISVCVKSVATQKDSLPQAGCAANERCSPCYDPRSGEATGACSVGPCDQAKEGPRLFESCGAKGDDALCVPAEAVPARDRCYFDAKGCGSGCQDPGSLCLPKKTMEAGPSFQPKTCQASMSGFYAAFLSIFSEPSTALAKMAEYSDARCLSKCIPSVRAQASLLSSSGCDPEELCVPCFDPTKLSQGKVATGACDRPACPGTSPN